jgi:Putative neutral zinc metallopeptidase
MLSRNHRKLPCGGVLLCAASGDGLMRMRYLSALLALLSFAQEGGRDLRSSRVLLGLSARRDAASWNRAISLLVLPVMALAACRAPAPAPAAVDVSSTVTAAVQATLQAQPVTRGTTPAAGRASAPNPTSMLDEAFATAPQGWPNHPSGTTWYSEGAYRLHTRVAGEFIVLNAPLTDVMKEVVVSARFRKTGGPPGGGYGLVVADQGPDPHDGVNQGGRFVVLEAGDQGLVGAWQREEDRWIDLQPWTPSPAVHEGGAVNELMVRVQGQQLAFLVNGTQVTQVTTKLGAGRVGVFVGGDGNQVALERFTVQSATSTIPSSARSQATASSEATATPRPPPTPTATATPVVDALLSQLDAAWAQGDWPTALTLLDRIEQLAPSALDFQDKRYAAHVAAGQDLMAKGSMTAAIGELTKARDIDPDRGEARAALVALTPTPTLVPALPSASKPLPQFAGAVLDDVDGFWSRYFGEQGVQYKPASRHWYEKRVSSACGSASPGDGPFYCPRDAGLYLDTEFIQMVRQAAGDFPVAYVFAHEVAHHAQGTVGVTKINAYILLGQSFSLEIELQADCLAGVWSKSASDRRMAAPEDVTRAIVVAWALGDSARTSPRSSSAHGSPDQRAAAFLKGFNGNEPIACGFR